MLGTHVTLSLLWIVYCVVHSLLAAAAVKLWVQQKLKNQFRYYRIAYSIFSFLGLVAILIYQFSMQTLLLFHPGIVTQVVGMLLMATGATVMLIMIRKYFMQLSGIRWLTQELSKSKLQVTGLHRYVRHPLYSGTFIFLWGWFIFYPALSFLICSSIITLYTLIALKYEEQKLIQEYGNDYIQYRKKVPSLLPKL